MTKVMQSNGPLSLTLIKRKQIILDHIKEPKHAIFCGVVVTPNNQGWGCLEYNGFKLLCFVMKTNGQQCFVSYQL